MRARCRLVVTGVVQGVGFRPFVYRTAASLGLAGCVRNTPEGVLIEVEGPCDLIEDFVSRLRSDAPALARVEAVHLEWMAPAGQSGFDIEVSRAGAGISTLIPPDIAVCRSCLREIHDRNDRRYRYPFTVCTECGPRFSIVLGLPYDRSNTTMKAFTMCPACAAEYEDPLTRRFHAEPTCCPRCGPRLWLSDKDGTAQRVKDPILAAARLLRKGKIVAIKGIGGFHLAVDAKNEEAVSRLRRLKQRNSKPFAVMVPDIETIKRIAFVGPEEINILLSPAHPIVLLRRKEVNEIAPSVAPGNRRIGAMLPYSPLHHLLLEQFRGVLVMTSANPHDEPIVRSNDEALTRLSGIADAFVFHDREIKARVDDSVVVYASGKMRMLRRSRGYVPVPLALPHSSIPVLGVGADLKNAFCLTRADEAFVGPYIGDLENAATIAYFDEALLHLCDLLDVRPKLIVHDLHPDYASTRIAKRLANETFSGATLLGLQHHHAHILSCCAEHGLEEAVIGIAADGMGYGLDGTSWGGEVLYVKGLDFRRLGHLHPLPLPGGDLASKEPWRMAVAALVATGNQELIERFAQKWAVRPDLLAAVARICRSPHCPMTTSTGRLFDAVSALTGLCLINTFEGEAAIALEHACDTAISDRAYNLPVLTGVSPLVMDSRSLLDAVIKDLLVGVPAQIVSSRFHRALVEGFVSVVLEARRATGIKRVALSGGVFQNVLLLESLVNRLKEEGAEVLVQEKVPTNDGGISLGQVLAGIFYTNSRFL